MGELLRRGLAPVDGAGLAIFRMLFGGLCQVASLRFVAAGWIEQMYVVPTTHFSYWGFGWVEVLPAWAMYATFGVMAASALCVMLGLFYRVAIACFFVAFTYVELIDVTNYLNHYYLVSILAFLMCWMPLGDVYGLDGLRRPERARSTLPSWVLWILRFQVGVVYAYAAIAKTGSDWLVHGQPMGIWMAARTDTALIGPYLDMPGVALAMSWGGFLYDATVVPLMLWSRTRPYAFVVAIGFHGLVGVLFNIGMFPWIMIVVLTLFFTPSWPRRWFSRLGPVPVGHTVTTWQWTGARRLAVLGVACFAAVQVAVPARAFAYGGDVLWHEQGMRFAWKVMVREKSGSVTYRVNTDRWSREKHVYPSRYLTSAQEREMAGQPDQILQLAHKIADDLTEKGHTGVEVRVDALVSLNGRRMASLIDPAVDLTTVPDGLAFASWILPAPTDPPISLKPLRRLTTSSPTP